MFCCCCSRLNAVGSFKYHPVYSRYVQKHVVVYIHVKMKWNNWWMKSGFTYS